VRSAAERAQMARWIEAQRRAFPQCALVVTARCAGYVAGARLDIPHLELSLERFREPEIRAFLEHWYVTVETAVGEDSEFYRRRGREAAAGLWKRIGEAPELLALAANPLMLQIIALVHRDRGALPERRVELYDECINVLLEHWDRAKQGLDVPLTAKEARRVLRPIAYWMHQIPERRFAVAAELLPQVKRGLAEFPRRKLAAEEFLETIRDRSGLFTGHGVDEYGFQHLSFQEFLAAEEIREQGLFRALVRHYGEAWWREVTRLLMGLENPSCFESFMRELVKSERLLHHHDLTAACVNDAFTVSAAPFVKALSSALAQRSKRPAAGVRQYSLLLALRALPAEALGPGVPVIRRAAAQAMTEAGRELALELLARAGVELPVARDAATGLPELVINPRDGMELVLIPAGEFLAGHKDEPDNRPRRMPLDSFYLARYPVTNAQYAKFLEANPDAERPAYWDDAEFNEPQQPVVGVTWGEAKAYCRWAGLRLPTEWEWEKGARGTDGRAYPWGDEPPAETRANFGGNVGKPTPVGSYPAGASPYGLMDMAGNVWEWTASEYEKTKNRTVRGGAFGNRSQYLRAAYRSHVRPVDRDYVFGFRCARDPVAAGSGASRRRG
jgi:formylglycine-generating enzyme required for sulfatase activity